MDRILVLGAGRSSSCLISYLLKNAKIQHWHVVVGDVSEQAARDRVGNSTHGKAIAFDIADAESSKAAITSADVVISMIPAHLHTIVAKICLAEKKHLLTASYVSEEMKSFHQEAQSSGLLFLQTNFTKPSRGSPPTLGSTGRWPVVRGGSPRAGARRTSGAPS